MSDEPAFSLYRLDRPLDRDSLVEEFAAMPGRLADALQRASHADLARVPGPGEWSAFQVVCHFRDIALVYGLRFRWMVFNDDPFLPDYDENRWVAECRDRPGDLPAMLEEIAAARSGACRMLARLDDGQWQRTGRHEILGTVMLEDYVRHQLAHEEGHVQQVKGALKG